MRNQPAQASGEGKGDMALPVGDPAQATLFPFECHGYVWHSVHAFATHMGMEALRLSVTGKCGIPTRDLIIWFQQIEAAPVEGGEAERFRGSFRKPHAPRGKTAGTRLPMGNGAGGARP